MSAGHRRLVANDAEVAARIIDGEAVFLNLSNGTYYSMDGVGGFVWSMVGDGASLEHIARAVATRYEVSEEQATSDVLALSEELLRENLVRITDTMAPSAPIPAVAERLAYAPPRLQTYRDMGDLLALDPPLPGLTEIPWEPTDGRARGSADG